MWMMSSDSWRGYNSETTGLMCRIGKGAYMSPLINEPYRDTPTNQRV
jgi:hypothetical protein